MSREDWIQRPDISDDWQWVTFCLEHDGELWTRVSRENPDQTKRRILPVVYALVPLWSLSARDWVAAVRLWYYSRGAPVGCLEEMVERFPDDPVEEPVALVEPLEESAPQTTPP